MALTFDEIVSVIEQYKKRYPEAFESYEDIMSPWIMKLVYGSNDIKSKFENYEEESGAFAESGILVNRDCFISGEERINSAILRGLNNKGNFEYFIPNTETELVAILDTVREKGVDYGLDRNKLSQILSGSSSPDVIEPLKNDFNSKLTVEEQQALVMYKTRMFRIMNYLWRKYPSISAIDESKIRKEMENPEFLEIVNDCQMFFKKAQQNAENKEFFTFLKGYSFENSEETIVSAMTAMELIEEIKNKIVAKEDMVLFRGVYHPNEQSVALTNSRFASTTPDRYVAIDFAKQNSGKFGNKTLMRLDVKKGTPIIPLMFSVITTMPSHGPFSVDINDVSPEEILIEMKNTEEIQQEFLIDTNNIQVENTYECENKSYTYGHYQSNFEVDNYVRNTKNNKISPSSVVVYSKRELDQTQKFVNMIVSPKELKLENQVENNK